MTGMTKQPTEEQGEQVINPRIREDRRKERKGKKEMRVERGCQIKEREGERKKL